MNCDAVDAGVKSVHKVDVPASWADATGEFTVPAAEGRNEVQTNYINKILKPTNAMEGDAVPVSVFVDNANGSIPSGTAAYEKRGIAADLPNWNVKTRVCSVTGAASVCPHAVVRPFADDRRSRQQKLLRHAVPMKGA